MTTIHEEYVKNWGECWIRKLHMKCNCIVHFTISDIIKRKGILCLLLQEFSSAHLSHLFYPTGVQNSASKAIALADREEVVWVSERLKIV